jgi:hypothetical protein
LGGSASSKVMVALTVSWKVASGIVDNIFINLLSRPHTYQLFFSSSVLTCSGAYWDRWLNWARYS